MKQKRASKRAVVLPPMPVLPPMLPPVLQAAKLRRRRARPKVAPPLSERAPRVSRGLPPGVIQDVRGRFIPSREILATEEERAEKDDPREALIDVVLQGDCRGPQRCPSSRGKGKLDTGAASSFITPEAVRRLGLFYLRTGEVRGIASGKKPLRLPKYGVLIGRDAIAGAEISGPQPMVG